MKIIFQVSIQFKFVNLLSFTIPDYCLQTYHRGSGLEVQDTRLTGLGLIADFSRKPVRADADEGRSCSGHTGSTVGTHIDLTVITCRDKVGGG